MDSDSNLVPLDEDLKQPTLSPQQRDMIEAMWKDVFGRDMRDDATERMSRACAMARLYIPQLLQDSRRLQAQQLTAMVALAAIAVNANGSVEIHPGAVSLARHVVRSIKIDTNEATGIVIVKVEPWPVERTDNDPLLTSAVTSAMKEVKTRGPGTKIPTSELLIHSDVRDDASESTQPTENE